MPKMTDYVREGFKSRRRPWQSTELPEWWNTMVWAALALTGAIIGLSMLFTDSSPTSGAAAQRPQRYAVESMNPYAGPAEGSGPTPQEGSPGTDATSPGARPASTSSKPSGGSPGPARTAFTAEDFAATAAAEVKLTGGGTTVVPLGALNVARAAAYAEATGDWSGIPLIGTAKPSSSARTPSGAVVGEVTVADPAVTGTSSYLFSAMVVHDRTARPYLVQLHVERTARGYAIRLAG